MVTFEALLASLENDAELATALSVYYDMDNILVGKRCIDFV